MTFASYKEYCDYFDATFRQSSMTSSKNVNTEMSDAAASEGTKTEPANHSEKGKERTRGRERDRQKQVKNKMLPSHWPPPNASELNLSRW
jgi:uncharacterized protein YraI